MLRSHDLPERRVDPGEARRRPLLGRSDLTTTIDRLMPDLGEDVLVRVVSYKHHKHPEVHAERKGTLSTRSLDKSYLLYSYSVSTMKIEMKLDLSNIKELIIPIR